VLVLVRAAGSDWLCSLRSCLIRYLLLRVRLPSPLYVSRPIQIADGPRSKRHVKTHTLCRRCGNRAFHKQHKSAPPLLFLRARVG
jgi:hypothetical protein